MGSERCLMCERELIPASEREMLMWLRSEDPRGDRVAQVCPECEDYYCRRCTVKTGRSCPACGATLYNAGSS